jgi:hypothetical protein
LPKRETEVRKGSVKAYPKNLDAGRRGFDVDMSDFGAGKVQDWKSGHLKWYI